MNPGSESFDIDAEIINNYRRTNVKWKTIAELLGISSRTLRRWKIRNNCEDPREPFDESRVDEIVYN
jgi:uncharacterized protein YjcR